MQRHKAAHHAPGLPYRGQVVLIPRLTLDHEDKVRIVLHDIPSPEAD